MKILLAASFLVLSYGSASAEVTKVFTDDKNAPIVYYGPFDGIGISMFEQGFCRSKGFEDAIESLTQFNTPDRILNYTSITCRNSGPIKTFMTYNGLPIVHGAFDDPPIDGFGQQSFREQFCINRGYNSVASFDIIGTDLNRRLSFYNSITCSI